MLLLKHNSLFLPSFLLSPKTRKQRLSPIQFHLALFNVLLQPLLLLGRLIQLRLQLLELLLYLPQLLLLEMEAPLRLLEFLLSLSCPLPLRGDHFRHFIIGVQGPDPHA